MQPRNKRKKKWWSPPVSRSEAIDDARYYMYMYNEEAALSIIVGLCLGADLTGKDKYDESLECEYTHPLIRLSFKS